jgi:D-alanyl-lipoteichoic acid acyltransferase DltB (MBOAT superfamily)
MGNTEPTPLFFHFLDAPECESAKPPVQLDPSKHSLRFHTPENCNRHFLAINIRDFWNRWHISLSNFFREHVDNRFVLAALKGRLFKDKYNASYLGFLLSMGLMGLWHGTALHFFIYGQYQGVVLILTDLVERSNKKKKRWDTDRFVYQTALVFITFNLVCICFLIFSGHSGLFQPKYLIKLRNFSLALKSNALTSESQPA